MQWEDSNSVLEDSDSNSNIVLDHSIDAESSNCSFRLLYALNECLRHIWHMNLALYNMRLYDLYAVVSYHRGMLCIAMRRRACGVRPPDRIVAFAAFCCASGVWKLTGDAFL